MLYDTYGFPLDLTLEILEEKGMSVDEEEFNASLEEQKKIARASRGNTDGLGWEGDPVSELGITSPTEFVGYSSMSCEATVLGIVKNGEIASVAGEGDEVIIIVDKSPLYAEGGGQVGDKGILGSEKDNFSIKISDTKKNNSGVFMLHGTVLRGSVENGNKADLSVEILSRLETCRNHTATHLLQKALQVVLGNHIEQSGSYVDGSRLRFDFTHFESLTDEEIQRVENIVNSHIYNPSYIETMMTSVDEAKKMGAMALFGEKYGDVVRVVKAGDFSVELCGGTHVEKTSDIGIFKILSETGVAAGIRRIEAITGSHVLELLYKYENKLEKVAESIKSGVNDVEVKAGILYGDYRNVSKELESLKAKMASEGSKDLVSNAVDVKGVKLVANVVESGDGEMLKKIGDSIKEGREDIVVVLGTITEGKVLFLVMADDMAISKGAHSGNLIKEIAKIAGGGGGGKPHMAQAGGKNPDKLKEAVESAQLILSEMIK